MHYISTRGVARANSFEDMLFTGLASDGGLFVPEYWPQVSPERLRAWRDLNYMELAAEIMLPHVEPDISRADLMSLIQQSYDGFRSQPIAPLRKVDGNLYQLELFHGPTFAFKDFAMQFLAQVYELLLARRDQSVTIISATSGDTGAAAVEAFKTSKSVNVFILFPLDRISEVQQRQMTTVEASNIHVIGIPGSFDDCQRIVKSASMQLDFREAVHLTSVNSINWARVMAQVVYYFWSALRLGSPEVPVDFAVPTGNFGNVFAGFVAKKMGLPIGRLMVSSNRNDILTRFFQSNDMSVREVIPSLSPSMDIQVSSNFERLLFELCDRNGEQTAEIMTEFQATGSMPLSGELFEKTKAWFHGFSLNDTESVQAMRSWNKQLHDHVDPHSVTALEHARHYGSESHPTVALSTAHPAKFPAAARLAFGSLPPMPGALADLFDKDERVVRLPNDVDQITQWIAKRVNDNRSHNIRG